MKHAHVVLLLLLTATLLPLRAAEAQSQAAPARFNFTQALSLLGGSITVPPEWDGVWAITDSVYDCVGAFDMTTSELDTLCAGEEIFADPQGLPITPSCSGTVDATTIDVTCSASGEVFTDCMVTFVLQLNGTRTGETYTATSTTSFTYTGTGFGCDLLTDSCEQVNTAGTRISPAPAAYCATPVQPSSWGQVKTMYR